MVYETLQRIDALLAKEENWTHHAFARAWTNQTVPAIHPYAVKWCLEGAIAKSCPETIEAFHKVALYLTEAAHALYGTRSLVRLNDDFGYGAVRRVIHGALLSYTNDHPKVSR